MISVNPIFFQTNSISKIPSENGTKLFKNSKYLFADLIKVSENQIAEENDFPESFFKLTQNSRVQTLVEINKQDFDDLAESNINPDINPLLAAMLRFQTDAADSITVKPEVSIPEQGEIQFKDVDEKVLKNLLADLINSTNTNFPGIQNSKPQIRITRRNEVIRFFASSNQKAINTQLEIIIDQLDDGSSFTLKFDGLHAGELLTDINKFINQTIGDNEEVIESINGIIDQVKSALQKGKNKIDVLSEFPEDNNKIKLEVKIAKGDLIVKENTSNDDESLNRIEELINSKESVSNDEAKQKLIAGQVSSNVIANKVKNKDKFSFTIKIANDNEDNPVKDFLSNQFVSKDALRLLLRSNNNLHQLRTKVTDIFKNTEQINDSERNPVNELSPENNKQVKEKIVVNEKIKLDMVNSSQEESNKVNEGEIQKTSVEEPGGNKQVNPEKVSTSAKGKIKVTNPEFINPGTENTIETKQPQLENLKNTKEIKVEVENSEIKIPIFKNKDGNKQSMVDADQYITADEENNSNESPITKLKTGNPIVEKPTNPEKVLTSTDEKIKQTTLKLNADKNFEVNQTRLENLKVIKEENAEINKSGYYKPIVDNEIEGKQNIFDQYLAGDEEVNTDEPSFPTVNTEETKVVKPLNPEKVFVMSEEKIKVTDPMLIKFKAEQSNEITPPKFENIKIYTEGKVDIINMETNDLNSENKVESKQSILDSYIPENEEINSDKISSTKLTGEKIIVEQKINPEKVLAPLKEKTKTRNPELIRLNTEKIIYSEKPEIENLKITKEENVEVNKNDIDKAIAEKMVGKKQTEAIQNTLNEEILFDDKELKAGPKTEKYTETKNANTDKIKPVIIKNEKANSAEFVERDIIKANEIGKQEKENIKVTNRNKSGIKNPELTKQSIGKIEKHEQVVTDKDISTTKETVRLNKIELNKSIVEKSIGNKSASLENIKITQREITETNIVEVDHDGKQSDSKSNENSQEQKQNNYSTSSVKGKPESFSFDCDKKISATVNDLPGIKETAADKSILNNVVQNKVEEVFPQPKALNSLEMFSKVSELIQTKDKKSIEIKLDPPELGKMNIRIDHEQNKIYVSIEVKDENVRGMIFHNLDQLRQTMNQNGLQLRDFFVSLNGEEQKQFKSSSKNKRGLTGKTSTVAEKMNPELSARMMGYNTYEFLI